MKQQAAADAEKADAELNKVYMKVVAAATDEDGSQFPRITISLSECAA
jgi:uncharacterized protein YecT (DUF1311 family)